MSRIWKVIFTHHQAYNLEHIFMAANAAMLFYHSNVTTAELKKLKHLADIIFDLTDEQISKLIGMNFVR